MSKTKRHSNIPSNFDVIRTMSAPQLAAFLDEIWCIGCNDGYTMAQIPIDQADAFEASILLDSDWLKQPAGDAILSQRNPFAEALLLPETIDSISRAVGFDLKALHEADNNTELKPTKVGLAVVPHALEAELPHVLFVHHPDLTADPDLQS